MSVALGFTKNFPLWPKRIGVAQKGMPDTPPYLEQLRTLIFAFSFKHAHFVECLFAFT